jgi:hypothetical protein
MNLLRRSGALLTFGYAIGAGLLLPIAAVAQADGSQLATNAQPTGPQVLKAIYGKNSQSDSVSFWFPYSFSLGGVSYFTGFAYNTRPRPPGTPDFPAPDETVTITEATYRLDGSGASPTWSLLGVQRNGGQFGGGGDANEVDTTQAPTSYHTPSGQLVLAIPAGIFVSGEEMSSYELFAFDPRLIGKNAAYWSYLGNIPAGEENSAMCGPHGNDNIPCMTKEGKLTFAPSQGEDMPTIQVVWSGTDIDSPNHIRTLGPSDTQHYHFDNGSKTYKETKP